MRSFLPPFSSRMRIACPRLWRLYCRHEALPMVWWHPRLHRAWKIALSVLVVVISYVTYVMVRSAVQQMAAALEQIRNI